MTRKKQDYLAQPVNAAKSNRPNRRRPPQRDDLMAKNPIAQAVARNRVQADLRALRTRAGIQAYMGGDAALLAHECGRLVYVVAYAANLHGLQNTPEARILAGTANALGDVVECPGSLDAQRGAILSGLDACERLLPRLNTWSLAAGALALGDLLETRSLHTGDVRAVLRGATA